MEISLKEFQRLDIKVGLVKSCERIKKSKNLYKLMVDCGEKTVRQILTGISQFYSPNDLINEKIIVLTNIKSRKIMGIESQGMLLAADFNNEPFLLKVDEKRGKIPPGTKIK
jgi:methionine--tRNA ligase beta chain